MLKKLVLCTGLALAGCSTTATITRVDGVQFEAELIEGDDEFIYGDSPDRGPGFIRRAEVKDIDHPGNVVGVAGTLITGAGLAVMLAGIGSAANCNGDLCGFAHLFMTLPGAAVVLGGLPPMIWGWVVYTDSVAAAESRGPVFPLPPPAGLVPAAHGPAVTIPF